MSQVIELNHVEYHYKGAAKQQGTKVKVVKGVSANFENGKLYAIVGRSGSGKTTLLSLMAGLDTSTGGEVFFQGQSLARIDRDYYRSHNIGMIFQSFNLIPQYTALENVMLSLELCGYKAADSAARAKTLLERVGLTEDKISRKVLKLSGGEQQRVAIARALGPEPSLILADEPTGNLDTETGEAVLELLSKLAHEDNKCVIVVTHAKMVADAADEVLIMRDGIMAVKDSGVRA